MLDHRRLVMRAEHSFAARAVNLHVFNLAGTNLVGKTTFKEYPTAVITPPAFSLDDNHVQELIDDLWRAGFRPTEEASTGQLQAMKDHVGDLRMVTRKLFGIVEGQEAKP